jgi:hypothetical protein
LFFGITLLSFGMRTADKLCCFYAHICVESDC